MTEKPKPCPMCGGKTDYSRGAFNLYDYAVFCVSVDCNMTGPVRQTRAEAIQAWNELCRITPKRNGKS